MNEENWKQYFLTHHLGDPFCNQYTHIQIISTRGEVENVLAYHETVKTEVQQQRCRLSIHATSMRSVFSSLGWSDAPSYADAQQQRNRLSIDSTSRRSSVFSSLGWSDPNNSREYKHSLNAPPFRSIHVSRHLTRRRSSGLSLGSSKRTH